MTKHLGRLEWGKEAVAGRAVSKPLKDTCPGSLQKPERWAEAGLVVLAGHSSCTPAVIPGAAPPRPKARQGSADYGIPYIGIPWLLAPPRELPMAPGHFIEITGYNTNGIYGKLSSFVQRLGKVFDRCNWLQLLQAWLADGEHQNSW